MLIELLANDRENPTCTERVGEAPADDVLRVAVLHALQVVLVAVGVLEDDMSCLAMSLANML